MIFRSVKGRHEAISGNSPSLYNTHEVNVVFSIIGDLFQAYSDINQNDIVIINPYRGQLKMLKMKTEEIGCKEIKIATVGEFQGGEKQIIIITTVKSASGISGEFVSNPKL